MKISIEQHADAGSDTLYMTVTVANAAPSLDLKQILNYELPLLADPFLVSASKYGQTIKLTVNRAEIKHISETLANIIAAANNVLLDKFPAVNTTYTRET